MSINLLFNDPLKEQIQSIIDDFEVDKKKFIDTICACQFKKLCSSSGDGIFKIFGREFQVVLGMEESYVEAILYKFAFTILEIKRNANGDIIKKEPVECEEEYFYTLNHKLKRTDSRENYTIDDVLESFKKWFEKRMKRTYIA